MPQILIGLHLGGGKPKTDPGRPAARRDLWPLIGNAMKSVALLIAICTLSQAANAQTPDCKSIAVRKDRLACYDKAGEPAKSTTRPAAAQPAASGYVDPISAEDARMNAQLKNICRGC
jgi:hypothetical protein